jgi:orotate phosphoribosyltransferase-like protein
MQQPKRLLQKAQELSSQGATQRQLRKRLNLGAGTIGILNDAAKMEDLRLIDNQLKAQGINNLDILFYNAGVAQFAPCRT